MRPNGNLFAAVDAAGQIRFINDVPSGAACACFCAACGSPLVARKGTVKVHHFAHEASQERPECVAGALNLLRRLTVEFLRDSATPVLPAYRRQVSRRLLSGLATELVEWDAQPVQVEWFEEEPQGAPIGRMVLDNDLSVDVLLAIAEDRPRQSQVESTTGTIAFYTYLPDYEVLCSRAGVLGHLRETGLFVWIYQPDVYGLLSDATKRLRARYDREEALANERATRERERFEQTRAFNNVAHELVPAKPEAAPVPPWATEKKKNASFFGYRLPDGSAWVHFELARGGVGLREMRGHPQWHEGIPASVGHYDKVLDVIVCSAAPIFSSPLATRISSDLNDVLQLIRSDWNSGGFFNRS
jgi:hypothetical protein